MKIKKYKDGNSATFGPEDEGKLIKDSNGDIQGRVVNGTLMLPEMNASVNLTKDQWIKAVNSWALRNPERVFNNSFEQERKYITDDTWKILTKDLPVESKLWNKIPSKNVDLWRANKMGNSVRHALNTTGVKIAAPLVSGAATSALSGIIGGTSLLPKATSKVYNTGVKTANKVMPYLNKLNVGTKEFYALPTWQKLGVAGLEAAGVSDAINTFKEDPNIGTGTVAALSTLPYIPDLYKGVNTLKTLSTGDNWVSTFMNNSKASNFLKFWTYMTNSNKPPQGYKKHNIYQNDLLKEINSVRNKYYDSKNKRSTWINLKLQNKNNIDLIKDGKTLTDLALQILLQNKNQIENLIKYYKMYDANFTLGDEIALRKYGPHIFAKKINPLASQIKSGEHEIPLFGTDEVLKYTINPIGDEQLARISTWSDSNPEILLTIKEIKPELPKEYINALNHNIEYINKRYPNMKLFGSAASVKNAGFPHSTHDIDFLVIDKDLNPEFIKSGKVTRTDDILKNKPATYQIALENGKYGDAGNIDANVIYTNPITGYAEGSTAVEIALQFMPKEYERAVIESLKTGNPIELHVTPQELFKLYDPTAKTIADSFLSSKLKHIGRDFIHMIYDDPDQARKGLNIYVQSVSGLSLKEHYPLETFLDIENNKVLLELMKKANEYMLLFPDNIVNDPKRMLLLYDYYMFDNTSFGRGFSRENKTKISSIEDIKYGLENWIGNNYEAGAGTNTVRSGDSGFDGYLYSLIKPQYEITGDPKSLLDLIHNIFNNPNFKLSELQIKDINGIITKYNNLIESLIHKIPLLNDKTTLADVISATSSDNMTNKTQAFPQLKQMLQEIYEKTGIVSSNSGKGTNSGKIKGSIYSSLLTSLNSNEGLPAKTYLMHGYDFGNRYLPKSGTQNSTLLHKNLNDFYNFENFDFDLSKSPVGLNPKAAFSENPKIAIFPDNPTKYHQFNPNYDPVFDLNYKTYLKLKSNKIKKYDDYINWAKVKQLELKNKQEADANMRMYKRSLNNKLKKLGKITGIGSILGGAGIGSYMLFNKSKKEKNGGTINYLNLFKK